jgi:hypothetical protein
METEDISPFFSRCHLRASRKEPDGKSDSAAQKRSGQSSYSGNDARTSGSGRDSSEYPSRDASGGFDGE